MQNQIFETGDLGAAAFVIASRKLRYIGCRVVAATDRVLFQFEQPSQGDGEALRVDYETDGQCSGRAFFSAIKALRRAMSEAQEHTSEGAGSNGTSFRRR